MNLYFLVEGKRTEVTLYPEWIKFLKTDYIKIDNPFLLNEDPSLNNTFFIFSGEGYPSILDNHLRNTVNDINRIPRIDHLIVCVDAEDRTIEETKTEIYSFIEQNSIVLDRAQLTIIVQNCCIETWLLGNRRIFSRNSSNQDFLDCVAFYNVLNNDPELMGRNPIKQHNKAGYHEYYLKRLVREKNSRYSKRNPGITKEKYYFDELVHRKDDTNHISSFGEFISFLADL